MTAGYRGHVPVLHRYSRGRIVTNIQGRGLQDTKDIFGCMQDRVGFYYHLGVLSDFITRIGKVRYRVGFYTLPDRISLLATFHLRE